MTHGTGLEGQVAAVTGASSGIGAATAEALARAGVKVAIGARRVDRLDELAERIGGDEDVLKQELDVGDEASANAFVRATHERFGRLDILVNNAGVMLLGPVEGAETEQWREMVNANVFGLLYCTHAALPIMREAGGGHIVNVSSVAGRIASLGSGVYNLTKWGLNGFSEALRQETVDAGIRVTVVEPGTVETELQGHNKHPMVVQAMEQMRKSIPDPLQAEDIADAILWAVSRPKHVAVNEVLVRPTQQRR